MVCGHVLLEGSCMFVHTWDVTIVSSVNFIPTRLEWANLTITRHPEGAFRFQRVKSRMVANFTYKKIAKRFLKCWSKRWSLALQSKVQRSQQQKWVVSAMCVPVDKEKRGSTDWTPTVCLYPSSWLISVNKKMMFPPNSNKNEINKKY